MVILLELHVATSIRFGPPARRAGRSDGNQVFPGTYHFTISCIL